MGLEDTEADLDCLADPVLLAEEDAVLLIVALVLAVRLVVVVREELVEPVCVLLPVALGEKKGLDDELLELILVRVLVLLDVVVEVGADDMMESCELAADFVAVVVFEAVRDGDAVRVGRT